MKHWMLALIGTVALSAAAGERETLQKEFQQENAAAEKIFQEAMTTVELTVSSGNEKNTAEKQLFRALDYKLRHTADPAKRQKLLEDFYYLSKEIQKVLDTPREDMGSLAGMQIYSAAKQMMQNQINILLLNETDEKRWEKFADSTLLLKDHELKFKFGKTEYTLQEEPQPMQMEIYLLPENTFQFQGRDFAIIREDLAFTCNDDFSTVYLCELKNGKLLPLLKCASPYFSKWTLQGNTLQIHHKKQVQTILLAPTPQSRQ